MLALILYLHGAFKSIFRRLVLYILVSEQNLVFVSNGYVTNWYQIFWFNVGPVWAKDQCEFGKITILEFDL